uniref:Fibronectin type-III domain-containing protein n=1 Tax=Myripristis murdjan TaxID=586833 RepID=A0A667X9S8_9TELE
MGVKLLSLLLLWDLAFFIQDVASLCSVTCTTDMKTSLNCSCSGSAPAIPLMLEAKCRDREITANGSCEITPSQSWCIMHPEKFDWVNTIGTNCSAGVNQEASPVKTDVSESSSWVLTEMVKPMEPFGVQVSSDDSTFNITWDMNNDLEEPLNYRVRIRESKDLSKDPVHSLLVNKNHVLIHHAVLQPHTNYTVDVQAILSPEAIFMGPWSEWSPSAEWQTKGPTGTLHMKSSIFLYMYNNFLPDKFFEPLYRNYEGNFKNWVGPGFSEYDVLYAVSMKQPDILPWKTDKQSFAEDDEVTPDRCSCRSFQPHSASLLHYHDESSERRAGHSSGHISISTVTLSGEEEFEVENASESSINTLQSYQDGESFSLYAGDNSECVGCGLGEPQASRMCGQGGVSAQDRNQRSSDLPVLNLDFQPRAIIIEPERVSLDSFVSNGQSEDGYPCVDLDTIDSGFGEPDCSSPVATECNTAERIDSDLFHEERNSNSNYVKQWMICSTLQEDPSTSANTLPKT